MTGGLLRRVAALERATRPLACPPAPDEHPSALTQTEDSRLQRVVPLWADGSGRMCRR